MEGGIRSGPEGRAGIPIWRIAEIRVKGSTSGHKVPNAPGGIGYLATFYFVRGPGNKIGSV